jgi:hypothetical protein
LQGSQGGGGGGSRLDSMSDDPQGPSYLAPLMNPPLAPSAYDAKGGGGGGGAGAVAIYSLGEIVIKESGKILAKGGRGGGGEVIGHCNFGGGGGGGAGGTIVLNSGTRIYIEHTSEEIHGQLDVSGGWGADGRVGVSVTYNEITDPCEIKEKNGQLLNAGFCSWARADGGYGSYGLIQLMVPDPTDPSQLQYNEDSIMATVCQIDHEPNFQKTGGTTGFSWYHFEVEGLGPGNTEPFIQHFPETADCLIPPIKTKSTLNPVTYALSKWLDMGRVIERPSVNGETVPLFEAFEGIMGDGPWGLVNTQNGFVVNASIPDFNDIEVDAPDLGISDYIPDTNEVAIQFQATDALVPGSKVPNEDPGVVSDWTWDLDSLNGRQFLRFRIKLDVAKGTEMKPENYKPQVNKVRIRFQY